MVRWVRLARLVRLARRIRLARPVLVGLLLVAASPGLSATDFGTTEWAEEIFAGLPERFVVESVETAETAGGTVFRFRSGEPIRETGSGPLYARFTLGLSHHATAGEAAAAVRAMLDGADPDIGLSYAWDLVTAEGSTVFHLHADCAVSEERFRELSSRLTGALANRPGGAEVSFRCRCGGGCVPERASADKTEEVAEDDPSGLWSSDLGDLSLMRSRSGLSFSYLAVFGSTAHICEGSGVAALVEPGRYRFADDEGAIGLLVEPAGVRMELVKGIASFCGAGWVGDRFPVSKHRPPFRCTATVEATGPGMSVPVGDTVEVAPLQGEGGEERVLARWMGPEGTVVGVLDARGLDCPERGR